MLTSTLSLDTSSLGAPPDPAAGATIQPAEGGEGFAGQLAQAQSALPPGQNLAVGALPLQTLALGPAMEVVTAPSGGPDSDSLAEFAKAQGLDDDVIAWLFSEATQAQVQAQALVTIPIAPGVMALPGNGPAGAAPATGTLPGALPGTLAGTLPGALPAALPGLLTDADLVAAAAATAAATTAGWLQNQQAMDTVTTPATPIAPALLAAAVARAARLEGLADTGRTPAQTADRPVETLNLEMLEGLEALWDEASAARGDTGAGAGAGANGGAGLGAGASGAPLPDDALPATTIGQRAAGYQELSQRLGEAMAQRVIAQIERGNWEVRLMLKPAKLGDVEIDLTLRSGALDASFRATNPLTRDLLNDGLPRLREVLAEAGMDIAGLNVGSGRSQSSGGNPTPRQAQGPVATGSPGAPVATAPAALPRARSTGSGWDVLV